MHIWKSDVEFLGPAHCLGCASEASAFGDLRSVTGAYHLDTVWWFDIAKEDHNLQKLIITSCRFSIAIFDDQLSRTQKYTWLVPRQLNHNNVAPDQVLKLFSKWPQITTAIAASQQQRAKLPASLTPPSMSLAQWSAAVLSTSWAATSDWRSVTVTIKPQPASHQAPTKHQPAANHQHIWFVITNDHLSLSSSCLISYQPLCFLQGGIQVMVTFVTLWQFFLEDEVQLSPQLQMLSAAAKETGTFSLQPTWPCKCLTEKKQTWTNHH